MKRFLLAIALVSATCGRRPPEVPENKLLLRIDAAWNGVGGSRRTAPATIVAFRSDGEFVEFHGWLIEQPDTTLYVASGRPRVAIVGRWERRDSEIRATRRSIARTSPFPGARDPLCDQAELTFRVSGNSVIGNAGEAQPGSYSPVTRLVSPDFESAVKDARNSQVTCGVKPQ